MRMTWRVRARATVVAAALLAGAVGVDPAAAVRRSAGGYQGGVGLPEARCTHTVRGQLVLSFVPPNVTGANVRRGLKDRNYVKYSAYLTDAGENDLAWSGWSGWNRLRDDQSGTWTGVTTLAGDWRGSYVVDLKIEWWNTKRRLGWAVHRIERYRLVDSYGIDQGTTGRCAVTRPDTIIPG